MRKTIILFIMIYLNINLYSQVLFDQSFSPPAVKWRSVIGSLGHRPGHPGEAGLSEDWSYDITTSNHLGNFSGYVTCGYAKTLNSLAADPTKCDGMVGVPDFNELENWNRRKGFLRPKFLKVNEKGELVWYSVINNTSILDGELFSLKQTSDGGFIGVGQATISGANIYNPTSNGIGSIYQSNHDGKSGLIVKINGNGITQWVYAYGLSDDLDIQSDDYPNKIARRTGLYDIVETDNGNYIAIGYSSISSEISGRKSVFLLNINSQGIINWKTSYIPSASSNMEFFGNSINKVGNEFILGGMHIDRSNNTNYKPFFIKRSNESLSATTTNNYGFDNSNNPSLFENTKMNSFVVKGNFIYSASIHSCAICPISGEHGEGYLKVDVFNKNTLNYVKSINIHSVKAYDLKAGISLTSDNELLIVSAALNNTWQWLWGSSYSFDNSCGGSNSTATLGYSDLQWWSSDALVAKIDLNDNVEWIKIFDAQNTNGDFPLDIRNEECLYNITEGPNGDIVAVGNCSKNLDDDYIVSLSKCQDNTDPSDCMISLIHIRNDNGNHNYTFSTNENWIGANKVVAGRIIVETGATLTIKNSTVLFTPNSKTNLSNTSISSEVESYILVKPGGTLIVDNSTLKAQGCGDQFWRGIIVEGCGSDDNQPPLNQVYDFNTHDYSNVSKLHPSHACAGKVIITPGSILMNARTAVYSGSFVGDWDDTKTGGIVISDGATFLNNHRDVGFVNYTKPNISYFKNTKFESNNYNDRTGLNHVTAWNVDNIVFEACDFMANNTNNPTYEGEYIDIHRGVGIYSIDSKLKVKPTCQINSTTGECLINGNYKPSTFTNLYRGIDANGSYYTDLTPNIQVGYAKFNNCLRGVHLQGMMYPVVGHSMFWGSSDEITQLFNDRKSCHMHLQGCSSYLIEDNAFSHDHSPITNPLDPQSGSYFLPYGLVVNNANTKDEKIYRNTFEQLLAGAGSVGLNGKGSISSTDISGLQWLCNGFVDNNNDINTFTGDGTFSEFPFLGINPLISNIGKIRPQQGKCADVADFTSVKLTSAANNVFTDKPFNNTGYNWLNFGLANEPHWDAWANPVSDNYQYNFTANFPSMEPVLYKLQLNKNVCVNNIYNAGAESNSSCPRTQPQSLFLKKLIIDEFKVKTLSAKSVIDGAVSAEDYWRGLLANATDENIDDIVSSLAELDFISPALLVDVIHNSHAGYAIQDIYNLLVQNSSIPQTVLQALVDAQLELTEEQIEDLINEQMQESPYQGVVNNYTYYNTKWQLAIDDLARTFIDSNLIDSAINLYIQHGSESSLQQAVPLLVQTQQYGLAQSILNNLVNIDSPFYASVSAYFNLLIDCKTNGISVFNIDTPKINELKEIAAGPSYVAFNAISLLEFISGQEFVEHIPNFGGEGSNKSEVTKVTKIDLWKQIKRKNAPIVQVMPNPAVDQFEIVVYSDQNEKNEIECFIFDMRGQQVQQQRFVLLKGYNYLKVDASRILNGMYHINVQGRELNLQSKVLISK